MTHSLQPQSHVGLSGTASPHPKTLWWGHLVRLSGDPRHSFRDWHFKDLESTSQNPRRKARPLLGPAEILSYTCMWICLFYFVRSSLDGYLGHMWNLYIYIYFFNLINAHVILIVCWVLFSFFSNINSFNSQKNPLWGNFYYFRPTHKKLGYRDAKYLVQRHTASRWNSSDMNSGSQSLSP